MSAGGRSRVTILGTGALASLFGARLARAGQEVTLVGSWRQALDAMRRRGIVVEEAGDEWRAPVRAARLRDADQLRRAPLVLVLVKSAQTRAVAAAAARLARPDGLVLSLQNGLGNAEILAGAAGADRVAQGVTSLGAATLAPGRVRPGGPGLTVLGEGGPAAGRLDDAAARLAAAGFTVERSADLDALVWGKLAVNAAINPLTALHGIPNGALLEDPALRARMRAAAREVGAVAAAQGIVLAADPAEAAETVARRTAPNRSSMLQDVDRGAPTEIEAICGAVVAAGARHGVPTPVNRELLEALRRLEARAERLRRRAG